jgi:hypothetical protein
MHQLDRFSTNHKRPVALLDSVAALGVVVLAGVPGFGGPSAGGPLQATDRDACDAKVAPRARRR